MYVYSSPKECFVGGGFLRFCNGQMFKFWYRHLFPWRGESSTYGVVALCNGPAALDANANYNNYTSFIHAHTCY